MKRNRVPKIESNPIAAEIFRYLKAHPDAADSVDGITHWWLLNDSRKSVEEVGRVIQRLTSEGVLEGVAQQNGATLYRRRRAV